MRFSFYTFLFFFSTITVFAQQKKSVKLYEKAELELRARNFGGAINILKKIIDKDPTYGASYLRLASTYSVLQEKDSALAYYERFTQVTPLTKVNPGLWITISNMNYQKGNYEKARASIEKGGLSNLEKPQVRALKASIDYAIAAVKAPKTIEIARLPDEINRFRLQYFPVLTVDNQQMIYTAQGEERDENLVISKKVDGQWSPAESISPNINSTSNEGACTVSADGRTLIFTSCNGRRSMGSCDLYISYKEGDTWSEPENLGPTVNTPDWESQPALSADGRTLFFASTRPGGLGARDIWVTTFDGEQWVEPKNLGPEINSAQDDITPYIHVNGQSLFFSSKGRPGMGGYDMYLSNRNESGWSEPVNLGYPINSYNDEVGIFITADGQSAYFSKEIADLGTIVSSEIMRFQIKNDTLVKNTSSYVTGRVLNEETNEPLLANFHMEDLNNKGILYNVSSDSVSGRYFLVLTQGHEYGVFISKGGYLFEDLTFRAKSNSLLQPDTIDIYLKPIKEGVSMILENVYFSFNEFSLDKRSLSELDQIYTFLIENPSLDVRIEGYTDNIGSEDYNKELSAKRALSVYTYLNKKGIDKDRLSYIGYGSSQPIDSNESASGREKNRRIEFRVIKTESSSQ